jgi:TolB protein
MDFDFAPAYSPDGTRIAFTSLRDVPPGYMGEPRRYSELYVMDADGTDVTRITANDNLVDFQATWSPDGQRILVGRGPGGTPPSGQLTEATDLWVIDLVTGQEEQITHTPGQWEGYADWSDEGSLIVFEGDTLAPGNSDVYTIRPDGTGLRRLTTAPGFDGEPDISPDGRTITFSAIRGPATNTDVFVMHTDGSSVRRLTNHPTADDLPRYSPDGQFIAFTAERDGAKLSGADSRVPDIFVMRADGTGQANLTRTRTVFEWDSDWQPEGPQETGP